MEYQRISEIMGLDAQDQKVGVRGWVRTFRANRFIALNDGSTQSNLQCVVDFEQMDESILKNTWLVLTTRVAVCYNE